MRRSCPVWWRKRSFPFWWRCLSRSALVAKIIKFKKCQSSIPIKRCAPRRARATSCAWRNTHAVHKHQDAAPLLCRGFQFFQLPFFSISSSVFFFLLLFYYSLLTLISPCRSSSPVFCRPLSPSLSKLCPCNQASTQKWGGKQNSENCQGWAQSSLSWDVTSSEAATLWIVSCRMKNM